MKSDITTYAIVGAGGRARSMFGRPIVSEFQEHARLVGICDIELARAELMSRDCGGNIPAYADFDEMIAACKPDTVIVTTDDAFHHEYIIRALESGCDAITEKPMTIDAAKCTAILEAERRTGKTVKVTFNCRFMPYVVRVKELLASGAIGDIQSVHLEWFLDRRHGASYFRRWHSRMDNSGGLLVHKSTHHFDMVNWWLDDEPEQLHAFGDLRVYGQPDKQQGTRCRDCDSRSTCEFYYDMNELAAAKSFYLEGDYIRDACVFRGDIDIYDTMSVQVKYARGALLSYSLTAYNPMEGWKASFVGSRGRIEAEQFNSGPHQGEATQSIRLYNVNQELVTIIAPKASGGHGGGDSRLRRMLFVGDQPDPLGQQAGSRAGAMSMLIGAGANVSIAERRPVSIRELLQVHGTSYP
ncbi:MAG: oxidoreductase domain protein [Paenibacillus sp.]|nr:oxidoreductase domain protein [Paenibacillus sp.]